MKEQQEKGEVIFSFTKNDTITFLKTEYKDSNLKWNYLSYAQKGSALTILVRPSSSPHQDIKKLKHTN